uniref:Alpha-carbonic anhydrase domain-containing protein n=1 Tax=Oryza meridionalis TaxID=40149 RepID=A0A0E0F2N9_9ORYZ
MVSSHAAAIVFFLVAASSLLSHGEAAPKMTAVAADYGYPADYGYAAGSKLGPENWGKLSPAYKLCGDGKKQSPIDIVTKQAISNPNLDSLNRTYTASDGTLMAFEPDKVGTVTVNGKVYSFRRVHWHAPSEHTINGEKHPLELQMVHAAADGSLAVIAILYKYGAPDSFYFQLKRKLAELAADGCSFGEENAQVALGLVHLRSLQKRTGSYFRYAGSLTAPPCTEDVVWSVLGKIRQISQEQVALITALLPAGGARPTQPLNGRTVQFYNPPNSTISFQV